LYANVLLLPRAPLRFTTAVKTLHVEILEGGGQDFKPPIQTDCNQRFEQFRRQPPKSNFKKLILETGLIKGLRRMSDKSCPKGLKYFEVKRGYTKRPPIPYIPVEYDMADAVAKASGASEYKLELPGGIKVQHALWESRSIEAFLKHVMSAMSYITRKGYFKEYAEAEKKAGQAVYDARIAKDL